MFLTRSFVFYLNLYFCKIAVFVSQTHSYIPIESLGFTLRTFILMSLPSISVHVCAHYTFCMLRVQFSVQFETIVFFRCSHPGDEVCLEDAGDKSDSDEKQQCSQRREAHRVKRRETAVTKGICCTFFSIIDIYFLVLLRKAHCCHIRKKTRLVLRYNVKLSR